MAQFWSVPLDKIFSSVPQGYKGPSDGLAISKSSINFHWEFIGMQGLSHCGYTFGVIVLLKRSDSVSLPMR